MDSPNPPIKIAEQQSLNSTNRQEYELIESLQANYEDESPSKHDGGYFFCMRKTLDQIWNLLIYGTAGMLNILDSALIKVVNRFYYHNI